MRLSTDYRFNAVIEYWETIEEARARARELATTTGFSYGLAVQGVQLYETTKGWAVHYYDM